MSDGPSRPGDQGAAAERRHQSPVTRTGGLVSQPKARLVSRSFLVLWAGSLAFFVSFQILLTALPVYAVQRLQAREAEIGLIIGLFAASAMLTRLPVGWVLERGHRVPVLAAGAAVFALSAAGYALIDATGPALAAAWAAGPLASLLALRLFHGTGMASFTTAGQTLVVDLAPVGRRGEALGVYGIAGNVASALGPAAGMALALALGFRALFATSIAVALVAVALSTAVADPLPRPTQVRTARLFNRAVLRPGLLMLALTFTYGAVASFVPLLAIQRGVVNPGVFFSVYAGAMVAAQAVAGRVSDRFGRSSTALPGLALAATGLLAISALGGWWLLAAGAIYGMGAGATQPALFAAAGDLAAPGQRGSAMATMGLFLELGISSGSIVAGFLAGPLGLATTFVIVAVVPLVGMVIGAASGRRGRAHPAALA